MLPPLNAIGLEPTGEYLFDLVKLILDDMIPDFKLESHLSDDDFYARISLEAKELSFCYASGRTNMRYSDRIRQVAYIFTYVAAHAYLFELALQSAPDRLKQKVVKSRELNMLAIGGGPGTEVLGSLKYLSKNEFENCRLSYRTYDVVSEWADVLEIVSDLCRGSANQAQKRRVDIDARLIAAPTNCCIEMTDEFGLGEYPDLVSIQFVLSEHRGDSRACLNLMKSVTRAIDKKTMVVVIDSNEREPSTFRKDVDRACRQAGLVHQYSVGVPRYMPFARNPLGDYSLKFAHNPRFKYANSNEPNMELRNAFIDVYRLAEGANC